MNKRKLHSLIEGYLEGSLPADKRLEVEQRMAVDETFRQEVELHRQMQEHFGDPRRRRLKEALSEVMGKPEAPDVGATVARGGKSSSIAKYTAIFAILLAAGFFFWRRSGPSPAPPKTAPSLNVPMEAPSPAPARPIQTTPQPPTETPGAKRPIATTDPRNFEPDASMEALVHSGFRGEGRDVNLNVPENGHSFSVGQDSNTELRFSGLIAEKPAEAMPMFNLLVFNNKDAATPLLTLHIPTRPEANGQASFDVRQQVTWQPGLYYFTIETADEEVVFAGKFLLKK